LIITTPDHPLTVSVSSEIRSDNVIVLAKMFSDPVPVSAMISAAVDQYHRRRALIAPVYIVKP